MSSPVVAVFMPHREKMLPLCLSSHKTKPCVKLGCQEKVKVGYEISGPPMVFSTKTHISSFKLGFS